MENTSGIEPVEFNVLIKPDEVEEKTKGGVILTADRLERDKHRGTRGTIAALSPLAFNADIWPPDTPRPEPGQRVTIALHAGHFVEGADGAEYRLIKDKDVTALIG